MFVNRKLSLVNQWTIGVQLVFILIILGKFFHILEGNLFTYGIYAYVVIWIYVNEVYTKNFKSSILTQWSFKQKTCYRMIYVYNLVAFIPLFFLLAFFMFADGKGLLSAVLVLYLLASMVSIFYKEPLAVSHFRVLIAGILTVVTLLYIV